jgi:hypothetical protein
MIDMIDIVGYNILDSEQSEVFKRFFLIFY